MAGNVREWCFNETENGRLQRGGAWDSPSYMFAWLSQLPPMDRSPQNGFRCALYPDSGALPRSVFDPVSTMNWRDYQDVEPVSDDVFAGFLTRFEYDHTELNASVEARHESEDWIHETISFDAAYGGERVPVHVFIPRNSSPPYQAVVYFPGSAVLFTPSSDNLESYFEFQTFASFIAKSGRALAFPVYKGTFERRTDYPVEMHLGHPSARYAEWVTQFTKDFRRTLDYLESRADIDSSGFGYFGLSWGGFQGPNLMAIDHRIRAGVIVGGGINPIPVPAEVDMIHYLPRVTTPTLMLNGRHDLLIPLNLAIRPMFERLGGEDTEKDLKLYDTDHIPPKVEIIRETLAWLDRYLGPVGESVSQAAMSP